MENKTPEKAPLSNNTQSYFKKPLFIKKRDLTALQSLPFNSNKKTKSNLDQKVLTLAADLDKYYLKSSQNQIEIHGLKFALNSLGGKLITFMEFTEYKILTWALSHQNSKLIDFFYNLTQKAFLKIFTQPAFKGFLKNQIETKQNPSFENNDFVNSLQKVLEKLAEFPIDTQFFKDCLSKISKIDKPSSSKSRLPL